jgi:WD40 repeat protein
MGRGYRLLTLTGHTASVTHVAADVGGRRVVTAAGGFTDFTVRVWDPQTGHCVHRLEGHTGPISSLRVSPDGRLALTSSGDQTARVWDLVASRCLRVLAGHTGVASLVQLASGTGAVAITTELAADAVQVWDLATGRCLRTIGPDEAPGHTNRLTSDGRYLLGVAKGTVKAWRLLPRPEPSPLQVCRPRSAVTASETDAQVADLVAAAARAEERGYVTTALDLLKDARSPPGHERSPELMAAWRRLAPSAQPSAFRTAWLSRSLDGGEEPLTDVCVTPDGRYALSSGHPNDVVWAWDLSTGRRVKRLIGHTGTVLATSVTPDGRFAVTGGMDNTARSGTSPTCRPPQARRTSCPVT